MFDLLATIAGTLLLVVLVREVFRQLLHPEGRGSIGVLILRGCRRIARRIGPTAMVVAGPASIGLVFFTWFLLAVIGWALLLYPHVPDGFDYGSSEPGRRIVDATYISMVTVSTLGYGDIVPATSASRVLAPLESVMGFGLLTATLTWMLSLYAPLARHRTLARHAHQLLATERHEGRQLQELASMVTAATVDLKMTYAIYYFHAIDERECFARAALPLWDVACARADEDDDQPSDLRTLQVALEAFAEALGEDFLPHASGRDTRTILAEYAKDDRRDAADVGEAARRS